MGRGKTPWENMGGHDSVLKDINKSPRRKERESREMISSNQPSGPWERIFWWVWRIGLSIDVGLILMVLYSYLVGWI